MITKKQFSFFIAYAVRAGWDQRGRTLGTSWEMPSGSVVSGEGRHCARTGVVLRLRVTNLRDGDRHDRCPREQQE